MGKTRAKPRMELIEMLQLGGKRQLMLVLCDGQRYLVGAGGDSIHSIASIRSQVASYTASSVMDEGQAGDGLAAAIQGLEQEIRCSS
jgi:flagellar biogenesis protein FliO